MKYLLIVYILLALESPSSATTTIILWSKDVSVIGSDSKTSSFDHSKSYDTCKIHVTNNILWGYAGVSLVLETNFSMDNAISDELSASQDVSTAFDRLQVTIMPSLVSLLRSLQVEDPQTFATKRDGQGFLEIAAINIDTDAVHVRTIQFIPHADPVSKNINVEIRRLECPSSDCGTEAYFALGNHDHADAMSRAPEFYSAFGAQGAINKMIEAEVVSHPDEVGLPIAMAEINRFGIRWVAKGKCQD